MADDDDEARRRRLGAWRGLLGRENATSTPALQSAIETAWKEGFDPRGAAQLEKRGIKVLPDEEKKRAAVGKSSPAMMYVVAPGPL